MRNVFALFFLATAPALAADAPKPNRYECVFPDKSTATVEAPDDAAADGKCRELWKKVKKPGWKGNPGVEDLVFSRRVLLR